VCVDMCVCVCVCVCVCDIFTVLSMFGFHTRMRESTEEMIEKAVTHMPNQINLDMYACDTIAAKLTNRRAIATNCVLHAHTHTHTHTYTHTHTQTLSVF